MTFERMTEILKELQNAPDIRIKIIAATLCGLLGTNDKVSNGYVMDLALICGDVSEKEDKRCSQLVKAHTVLCGKVAP